MKKYFKRYLALVLTFALVLAVPFVFTQQADAAAKKSKTTKYTQPVKETYTYKNEKNKTVKEVTRYSYNKNGFRTKVVNKNKEFGFKLVYKYNKKGYVKSVKEYNAKGKLVAKLSVKMNKNGMPLVAKRYEVKGKKSTLDGTMTFIYSGKKPVKYVTSFGDETGEPEEFYFFEGVDEKASYKTLDQTYDDAKNVKKDKKGRVKSFTTSYYDSEDNSTDTTVYTYKYNKAGYLSKSTQKNTYKASDGTVYKSTTTSTFKTFKYTKKVAKLDAFNWRILADMGFLGF